MLDTPVVLLYVLPCTSGHHYVGCVCIVNMCTALYCIQATVLGSPWRCIQQPADTYLAWWRSYLDGAPPSMGLHTDHTRQAPVAAAAAGQGTAATASLHRSGSKSKGSGSCVPLRLDPALSAAVQRLAGQCGSLPLVVVLSALKLLLARYTRQTDVVVGTLLPCRCAAGPGGGGEGHGWG